MLGLGISLGLGFGIPAMPATPSLSISADDGTVTVTIAGDAGATHYLHYKASSQGSWQDGGSRSGDGDIVVSGLADNVPYIFSAWSKNENDMYSFPSAASIVKFTAQTENLTEDQVEGNIQEYLLHFGEPIKYLPSGGGSRDITAIVDREPPAELAGITGAQTAMMFIEVANDSEDGISSSEINLGGDMVEISVRIGETAVQKRITGIVSQDVGMMKLRVR